MEVFAQHRALAYIDRDVARRQRIKQPKNPLFSIKPNLSQGR
tara:strand:- start:302 stop:427 length:126 start_codon:yes stop_codon:yes gene_type:complete